MRINSAIASVPITLAITSQFLSSAFANIEDIDDCTLFMTEDEEDTGVTAVYDRLCTQGSDDLGCFEGSCRRCLFIDLAEDQPDYYKCEDIFSRQDQECSINVSPNDKEVGISAQFDEGCGEFGGIGCFPPQNNTNCRFCATELTRQSQHLFFCDDVEFNMTNSTSSRWQGDEQAICPDLLSEGDRNNGIFSYFDEECLLKGGLGCAESMASAGCRFCKTEETKESKHLYSCNRQTQSNSTGIPEDACGAQVSLYGKSVGVSAKIDETCFSEMNVGCFEGAGNGTNGSLTCRYCQYKDTHQSSHLEPCSEISNYDTYCTDSVGEGERSLGVNAYLDLSCEDGGSGCFANGNCRYCRDGMENEVNSHLPECPTECMQYVENYDVKGVLYAIDEQCLEDDGSNNLGCQAGTSCRLCKWWMTRDADLPYCYDLEGLEEPTSQSFDVDVANTATGDVGNQDSSTSGVMYWTLGAVFVVALVVAVATIVKLMKKRSEPEIMTPQESCFATKLDTNGIARI